MDVAVRGLTKTFGAVRANDGIDLSFSAGAIHGVLGENGAGKSTLMKLLSGYLRPDSGTIQIDGATVQIHSPAAALAAGIGMVHQDPLDVPAFTAVENFACGSSVASFPNIRAARAQLLEYSARLGFAIDPDQRVGALTVGQRQQLEIMRLLACGARVLILDEPTTGISAVQAAALFAALRKVADAGNTVLFVSHKLDEVAELCSTVCVLRAGQVVGGPLTLPQAQSVLLELMFGPQNTRAAAQPSAEVRTPPALPPVWQLDHLTLRERGFTIDGLNCAIQAGAAIGLAGLEGSGQQLLLRVLAGRLRPMGGRVRVNDIDLTHGSADLYRQAGVQYLPADRLHDGMVGALSLADHLVLQEGRGLLIDRATATDHARRLIAEYAIKATPITPIDALSGGNQQRAMLALLPSRCTGILLDQPTRGLDVASAAVIWERLNERRSRGTALVFASADLDELLEHSDHVLVFFGGHVSRLLPRAELTYERLAELIGGVGFEANNA